MAAPLGDVATISHMEAASRGCTIGVVPELSKHEKTSLKVWRPSWFLRSHLPVHRVFGVVCIGVEGQVHSHSTVLDGQKQATAVMQPPSSNTGVGDTSRVLPGVLAFGIDGLSMTIPTVKTMDYAARALVLLDGRSEVLASFGGSECLITGGIPGYSVCAARGQVRAYFSHQERQGIHIIVGSAACNMGIPHAVALVGAFLEEVLLLDAVEAEYKLTRVDVFADVLDSMPTLQDFKHHVGRASLDGAGTYWEDGHYGERLATQYIGSPKSAIRGRVYNKLNKYDADDLALWGCTEETLPGAVTRVEWQIHVKDAKFNWELDHLQDELGAFAETLGDWFRLVVPSETDSNSSRWEVLPLFAAALEAVGRICEVVLPAVRGKVGKGVGRLLAAELERACAQIANIAARATDEGHNPKQLGVYDMVGVIEQLLLGGRQRAEERYRQRYAREAVLCA